MKSKPMPPVYQVRQLFAHDPETGRLLVSDDGRLTWAARSNSRSRAVVGGLAGRPTRGGHLQVLVGGRMVFVHRLVMLCAGCSVDGMQVDHVNGDRRDNRVENLRVAAEFNNSQNRGPMLGTASGLLGVSRHAPSGKWRASIGKLVEGRHRKAHLGLFDLKSHAAAASLHARRVAFPDGFVANRHEELVASAHSVPDAERHSIERATEIRLARLGLAG